MSVKVVFKSGIVINVYGVISISYDASGIYLKHQDDGSIDYMGRDEVDSFIVTKTF